MHFHEPSFQHGATRKTVALGTKLNAPSLRADFGGAAQLAVYGGAESGTVPSFAQLLERHHRQMNRAAPLNTERWRHYTFHRCTEPSLGRKRKAPNVEQLLAGLHGAGEMIVGIA